MASEGSGSGAVDVAIGPELGEWLETRAADLGIEPGELLIQLLAAYRAAAELDGVGFEVDPADADELFGHAAETALAGALRDGDGEAGAALRRTIEEHARRTAAAELDDQATEERFAAIEEQIDEVDAAFQRKLEDVRDRVIQVKRELDTAREADEFDHATGFQERLANVDERLAAIEERLTALENEVDDLETADGAGGPTEDRTVEPIEQRIEAAIEDRVGSIEERLKTVAWAVKDLRDDTDSTADDAVAELKRSAAAADVTRATCDNCGEGVALGLLTEPACPHCQATLADVEPGSFFRSARLLTAARLEAGDES